MKNLTLFALLEKNRFWPMQLIFALLLEQLQPASPDTPRDVVEETRLRASSLLCKTFLHYMYKIDASSFSVLWIKVLSFVEMYMKADNSELLVRVVIYPYQVMADLSTSLVLVSRPEGTEVRNRFFNLFLSVRKAEAVTESLKNILLVMFASGLLVRPPASQSESVLNTADAETNPSVATWNVTWKTIDGFCPSLKNEFLLKVCSYSHCPLERGRRGFFVFCFSALNLLPNWEFFV
jgi:brefeldin A-resistance guanine nucleotide exchange factor 1